jgi:hypothetical protein
VGLPHVFSHYNETTGSVSRFLAMARAFSSYPVRARAPERNSCASLGSLIPVLCSAARKELARCRPGRNASSREPVGRHPRTQSARCSQRRSPPRHHACWHTRTYATGEWIGQSAPVVIGLVSCDPLVLPEAAPTWQRRPPRDISQVRGLSRP